MLIMLNLKKISKAKIYVLLFISACALLGALFGWISMSNSIKSTILTNAPQEQEHVGAFVPKPAPSEIVASGDVAPVADPAELQIWEMAARQALPPRKEPLTPSRWRIVGVTAVGDEKSVLLLFANQTATEARKVGDKLPGGAKIVQISQDHLQISLNGQLMKLNLRKQ
jgi:hypothetical protein